MRQSIRRLTPLVAILACAVSPLLGCSDSAGGKASGANWTNMRVYADNAPGLPAVSIIEDMENVAAFPLRLPLLPPRLMLAALLRLPRGRRRRT